MTFRISTQTVFDRGLNAMLDRQSEISKTQLQLSTGRRILTAADDPAGAVRVLNYNRKIDTMEQYINNADRARSRLEFEEASLDGAENILLRVKELVVQGSSDTVSQADRQIIAQEIRELRDSLIGIANSQDSQGEYIFAGFQTGTIPFSGGASSVVTYQGDLGSRELQIASDRKVSDGDNGHSVFIDVRTATGKRSIFETLRLLANDLDSGTNVYDYVDDINYAQEDILQIHTTIGARLNAIDEQMAVNADVKLTMETHRAEENDLDYASAVSRFDRQMLALQAAQQAYIKVSELSLFNYMR
jgi:flagellar hook-associated protein 3 FlgL